MGHITKKEDILKELQKRLNHNPIGLPEHSTLYEILSILFTEKEAEVGSKFPFGFVTIDEIQIATKVERNELEEILKNMAKKGLVYSVFKDGQKKYLLSPGVTGFFEMTFMRTDESLPMKKLAELMHTYRNTPEFVNEFFSQTPRTKAYLYSDAIPKVRSEVLVFDEAVEHIKKAGRGSLGRCYCRHEAYHLGKNCSAPIEDICMSLGSASDFLVEQGFAKRASIDQLLDVLKKAEDYGLVHMGDNVMEQTTFICNCCGCCCGLLEGITKHNLNNAVTTTNYIATIIAENCNGCGQCEIHCQIKAIKILRDLPIINEEICLGCGVCSHFCPFGAIEMKEREKRVIPPRTYKELIFRLMNEKGRV